MVVEPDIAKQFRLLINDPVRPPSDGGGNLFSDDDLETFLTLEGGSLKRAAAQAIDTIADNEVLVGKVIRDQDVSTDGAKVADALRKRATALRAQADSEDDDGGSFSLVDMSGGCVRPELTSWGW